MVLSSQLWLPDYLRYSTLKKRKKRRKENQRKEKKKKRIIRFLLIVNQQGPAVSEFLGKLVLALVEKNLTNAEFATREHSQHSQTNKRKVRMWVTLSALVEYLDDDSPQLEVIGQRAWLALQVCPTWCQM